MTIAAIGAKTWATMAGHGLRRTFIKRRVTEKYGSARKMAAAWKKQKRTPSLSLSTLNRWLQRFPEYFPEGEKECLTFAAALDIDPVLLWDYDVPSFLGLCQKVVSALSTGKWDKFVPGSDFLGRLAFPRYEWPPKEVLTYYRLADWNRFDFAHEPAQGRQDFFATVVVREHAHDNQIWHFAYRDRNELPMSLWRHYGFAWRNRPESRLSVFVFTGVAYSVPCPEDAEEFAIQTWFGHGAADFCVASLHEFRAELHVEPISAEVPTIRFGYPEDASATK